MRPRLPFLVDDLTAQTENGLRDRGLTPLGTLTLLCLAKLRGLDTQEALAAFDRWADLMRAADRDDVGRLEGRLDTLLRQMAKRFGPLDQDVVDRVRHGSLADLDRWTDRILEAPTLDAVLAP